MKYREINGAEIPINTSVLAHKPTPEVPVGTKSQVKDIPVGSCVTCKNSTEAFYSDYAGNPTCWFVPGMVGRVMSVDSPFVRQNSVLGLKRSDTGILVDFLVEDISQNQQDSPWRVKIDYYNVVKM